MAVIKYQNQSDYAFLQWVHMYPESGHPLDIQRFNIFAKTVARYRNKKWLERDYFKERLLTHMPHFDPDRIERFWHKLCDFVAFYNTPPIPSIGSTSAGYDLLQRGVEAGKIYEVKISEEEYYGSGATKETMKSAEYI